MSANPVRLQLSRAKGFSLQALSHEVNGRDAVNVARPGKWGNPFKVGELFTAVDDNRREVGRYLCRSTEDAVDHFRGYIEGDDAFDLREDIVNELRGKNLACWCKPGAPCHADVLLEIANTPVSP